MEFLEIHLEPAREVAGRKKMEKGESDIVEKGRMI